MSYTRLHWVESETPLSAENMNNIEDGIEELKSQKVDKVSGKALSDNNYTTEEKQKLAGIAAGAEVNRTYTAVTGEPAADASVAFGGTVTVSQVAQSSTGQVSVTSRTVTFPNSDATTSAHGLMTAADKTKLNGVASGAEVNQNAFSNVKVGSSTIAADAKTDTLELAAGTNISLTADTTNDKVTITNSTPNVTTTTAGLMSATDKTKLNGIATGAQVNQNAFSHVTVTYNSGGSQASINAGSVTDTVKFVEGTNITLTPNTTNKTVTITNSTPNASTNTAGLMTAADKTKLNGIQAGAQVNPGNAT